MGYFGATLVWNDQNDNYVQRQQPACMYHSYSCLSDDQFTCRGQITASASLLLSLSLSLSLSHTHTNIERTLQVVLSRSPSFAAAAAAACRRKRSIVFSFSPLCCRINSPLITYLPRLESMWQYVHTTKVPNVQTQVYFK
jgi:hypothetical protein